MRVKAVTAPGYRRLRPIPTIAPTPSENTPLHIFSSTERSRSAESCGSRPTIPSHHR